MSLSPLQFIIIISGLVFFLFALDFFQRKKLNGLHFLVFFGGTFIILFFTFNIWALNKFWAFFWLNRWADLLVYISIILLAYFYFELLNRITKNKIYLTSIISNQALEKTISHCWIDFNEIKNKDIKDEFVFLIRAFNEETAIIEVIQSILKKWFKKIIIVNDGSSDNTGKIVKDFISKNKKYHILLLTHLINRGWWAANKTWFEFLKKYWDDFKVKWVVTYDADGQMDVDDMDNFLEIIKKNENLDVLLWSRFIEWGTALNIPFLRKIVLFGSKIITLFINWIWVSDPHNGYRVISLDFIKKINITSDNMTYASELIEEINRLKAKYKEVPVNIKYSQYSLSKWQKNSNAFKILFELLYKKFFYK
ncbi:MAG: Glycosyltransferases involved in cell wall biogenesis [uncultured bacterium (gcode 4)]|uniref:Glycosyltransferases involved in cell wall biogenesis n=1 Tax=uncultured bacterium (gcode 4) TaxID=1234023 RepID=K2AWN9_9BACT|nr:MAG: Glycosyltransferases involved in cell wall biogenesis [uncultured bacterium (gcode 4)]